ncbi:MAG: MipA/OmpV family protein [Betaproteobacteria bacterium]|nr:MipA/OmpV family protein [Betaproteobacteria bacterium]
MVVPLTATAELTNDSLLGPGLRWRPAYDGSASQRVELVPVVRYLGEPLFVRSTQGVLEGGLRMELAPGLHAGAQLAYEPGRKPGDSDFLKNRNVAGINNGASYGLQVEWDHKFGPMPVTLLGRVRQHVEAARGAQADLRFSAGIYSSGRFSAGVFAQTTWANAKSTNSFYGITPQQSAVTGLTPYSAGSGWLFGSVGLLWSVDITRNWIVVGSMEARRLQGDAAGSPLAERRSNYYLSAGVAYHF